MCGLRCPATGEKEKVLRASSAKGETGPEIGLVVDVAQARDDEGGGK
jgi:hypothetical protein